MSESINSLADSTTHEALPSLADFADEVGGAWPKGWYAATIIEGYATPKGKQFSTGDTPSQKGDSRNLRLCLKATDGKSERTMQESFNYRQGDFSAERLAFIAEARTENKGLKNWADKDAQRSSLAIGKLGQIGKAIAEGFQFSINGNGGLNVAPLIGVAVDIRLGINDDGFNEITGFAPAGSKTAKKS
jgi:hypothetical protein